MYVLLIKAHHYNVLLKALLPVCMEYTAQGDSRVANTPQGKAYPEIAINFPDILSRLQPIYSMTHMHVHTSSIDIHY